MKRFFLLLMLCYFTALTSFVSAEVRLPKVFGSGMVMQREAPVKIWGWAGRNESVELTFNGQNLKTRANKSGQWELTLAPMTAGGPYELTVGGKKNRVKFDDILVGDVWLCSGQSNMEFPVGQSANADKEIAAAQYPNIRTLNVPKRLSWKQADDMDAKWEVCSPETVSHFSAVAYFYARELHRELGVPIGIINSSWGGTMIEGWISPDTYLASPAEVKREYNPNIVASLEEYSATHPEGLDAYAEYAIKDKGVIDRWYEPEMDDSAWKSIKMPEQSCTLFGDHDGLVWFRYTFDIPASQVGKAAVLNLGRIDDVDITWVNGVEVGRRNGYTSERKYDLTEGLLKEGRNTICVRVTDEMGPGGLIDGPQAMYLEIAGKKIPVSGDWKYAASVIDKEFYSGNLGPNSVYSMLYNGMISPLTKFRIKGAIWYQGESNTDMPIAYRTLFPQMINDWRNRWGYEFPFYWVHLANFMAKDELPAESGWAELREAQTMTLSLAQTGQAVIIDIGDAADIHPTNKQDVGRRLALLAFNRTYGKADVVCVGPTFRSMQVQGDRAVVTMDSNGSALKVNNKYGYIEGFAIAGADQKFVWAKAYLDGDKIVVYSDRVKVPVAVRFAWGNNPDVNLYNAEGLPAVAFRTDSWK